jgi:hypothetical protein
MHFDYARNSYRDEFPDFLPRSFPLALHLTLLLMLCLISLMDLTITHMFLVHKRIALCLDALVTAHVLIVLIVFRVGLFFLLEGFIVTLSPDNWMIYVFPTVALVLLGQVVNC